MAPMICGRHSRIMRISVLYERLFRNAQSELVGTLAQSDEDLLERYLIDGAPNISPELSRWKSELQSLTLQCSMFPYYTVLQVRASELSALMSIVEYLPAPEGDSLAQSGVVFKIERNKTMGRMAFVRLYEGTIRNRDFVRNLTQELDDKVTQIRKIDGREYRRMLAYFKPVTSRLSGVSSMSGSAMSSAVELAFLRKQSWLCSLLAVRVHGPMGRNILMLCPPSRSLLMRILC